jgi:xanthine dehydrogenase accessory factor
MPHTYVIVASHGNYDEIALEAALKSDAAYVALVASKKRGAAVKEYLRESGLTDQQIARLKCPAGLDFGAVTPEEIALSILAEIVQLRRRGVLGIAQADDLTTMADTSQTAKPSAFAGERELREGETICPTCGMIVEIASAIHTTEHDGATYTFCCPQCKRRFEKDPEKFLAKLRDI